MLRSGLRRAATAAQASGIPRSGCLQSGLSLGAGLSSTPQRRCISWDSVNPFASKAVQPEQVPPAQPNDPFAGLPQAEKARQEEEEIQRLIDEDTEYSEPAMTFFESLDAYWDSFLTLVSPMGWASSGVHALHNTLGLEWWLCVMGMSMGARLAFLPVQLFVTRNQIRMSLYQTDLGVLKQRKQEATSNTALSEKDRAIVKNNYDAQIDALSQKGGFKEWYSFLTLFSVIPYGVVFYTTRQLMEEPAIVSSGSGGILWFKQIAEMDSTFALPVIAWLLMSLGNEMTMAQAVPSRSKYFVLQKWGGRVMTGVFLFLFRESAAGVMLGFVTAGFMGVVPPLLLRSAAFRTYFKVPQIKKPPRATIDVQVTGFRGWLQRAHAWMAGATFEKQSVLGGGLGSIAHASPNVVKNVSQFKVVGKR